MRLKGIVSAMVTPLMPDETVNETELRRQVDRQREAGMAAVFCLGTNGEFYAFEEEEKKRIISVTAEQAGGRIPVYAGTGCITTKGTISLTRYAKEAGADAVSVITPYFAGISQEGLYRHYMAVAEASELPVILYNIPARTGVNLDWETAARLRKHPNIIGIKDSSGNFLNTLQYLDTAAEDFAVLSGNDSLILWTLAAGGSGAISGMTNIAPELVVRIYEEFQAGNWQEARRCQKKLCELKSLLAGYNPNSAVKAAAAAAGQNVGPLREPFSLNSEELAGKIADFTGGGPACSVSGRETV